MKIKYEYEEVNMGEEIILVPVGKNAANVHGVLKANREGKEIINLLYNETTETQIVDILANKYNNNRESLSYYVANILKVLRSAGLIEE